MSCAVLVCLFLLLLVRLFSVSLLLMREQRFGEFGIGMELKEIGKLDLKRIGPNSCDSKLTLIKHNILGQQIEFKPI
jgi:hypothetical protein